MIDATMIIGLALKSFVFAGATLLALRLLGAQSAAVRSLVGHLGLAALIGLPLVTLLLPAWSALPLPAGFGRDVAMPGTPSIEGFDFGDVPEIAPASDMEETWPLQLAAAAYLLPLTLLFGATVVAVIRLFSLRRRAAVLVAPAWLAALALAQRRMGFKSGAALLVSDELRSPISWGLLRPTIVLNAEVVEVTNEAEAIIAHELAHVDQLDWAKLLAARVACALFWFNPLVWMLARECHQLREESADDAVLGAKVDRIDYATLLVDAARHDNSAVLLAAHGVAPGRGSLKRRIQRVLDAGVDRRRVGTLGGGLGMLFIIGLATPLAALQPRAGAPTVVAMADGAAVRDDADDNAAGAFGDAVAAAADVVEVNDGDIEALIEARAMARMARRERSAAAGRSSPQTIIAARALGADEPYAASLRSNLGAMDLRDVVAARAVGIDPAYIAAMRQRFPDADIDDIIGARAVGVSASYAASIRERFPDVDIDTVTGMRAVGVTGSFIDSARRSGIDLSDPDDAIALRAVTARPGPPPTDVPPALPAPPARPAPPRD